MKGTKSILREPEPEKNPVILDLSSNYSGMGPGFKLYFEEEDENHLPWEELTMPQILKTLPGVIQDKNVRVELCESKSCKRFLRMTREIPAFDSNDRIYDTWHSLYLIPGQGYPEYDAVYAHGGYELAGIKGYRRLLNPPECLKNLSFEGE